MATKKQQTNRLAKAKFVVKKINSDLIDASFDVIETSVKAGEKWQKLTAKMIKKSEPLTKKQISMFLETAENLKEQVELGTARLKTLVGYDPSMLDKAKNMVTENPLIEMAAKFKKEVTDNSLFQKAEKMGVKIKKEATDAFEDVKGKVENIAGEVKEKFEDFTEGVEEKIEDITDEVKEKVGKIVKKEKKVSKKKTTAKKVVAKKKPVTKKKAVAKKKVVASEVKNDLKVLRGVGPKMEEILYKGGITSFEQLAKMTLKDINGVLTAEGISAKVYNTSDWKAQAKIAIKGDMKVLSQWIKDNKITK